MRVNNLVLLPFVVNAAPQQSLTLMLPSKVNHNCHVEKGERV